MRGETNTPLAGWVGMRMLVAASVLAAGCAQLPLATTRPDLSIDQRVRVPAHVAVSGGLHEVVLVGNNWDGTATIFDPHDPPDPRDPTDKYAVITTVDIVPDLEERMREINGDKDRARLVGLNRRIAGEGHDQLVDDLFTSPDGRLLFASRPTLGDVVAIDLESRRIVWRRRVCGVRADHAALSPDGRTLLVSATTARWVHAIDTATGEIVGGFASGDEPHESHYSKDGQRIYHASIGRVFLPIRSRLFRRLKGDRWFEIVDASKLTDPTFGNEERSGEEVGPHRKILKRIDLAEKLREFARSDVDPATRSDVHRLGKESAVRPMAVTEDGRYAYLQISFLHGFIEYDLLEDRITRLVRLEDPAGGRLPSSKYQLNSAHHGIALNEAETKLCVAGTVSGYAAIVSRGSAFPATYVDLYDETGEAPKPYWATRSRDGTACYVSISGTDKVSIISFDEARTIGTVSVGDHPQRVRNGVMRLGAASASLREEDVHRNTVP